MALKIVGRNPITWSKQMKKILLILSLLITVPTVHASDSAGVNFVVPFSPGGASDVIARALSVGMTQRSAPSTVENIPGADSIIGTNHVGNTVLPNVLLVGTSSNLVYAPVEKGNLIKYHPNKDFKPVIFIAKTCNVIAVHPSSSINSFQDLVAQAQIKRLTYGTNNLASEHAARRFLQIAKINLDHVRYNNNSATLRDAIGNHIDVLFDTLPTTQAAVRAGLIKPLATTCGNRLKNFPTIPPVKEFYPEYEMYNWYGILASKNTTDEQVLNLNKLFNQILKDTNTVNVLSTANLISEGGSPQKFQQWILQQQKLHKSIIEQ
jgi:tripartite-type tricarboxylate transporter receptor subunit TctC